MKYQNLLLLILLMLPSILNAAIGSNEILIAFYLGLTLFAYSFVIEYPALYLVIDRRAFVLKATLAMIGAAIFLSGLATALLFSFNLFGLRLGSFALILFVINVLAQTGVGMQFFGKKNIKPLLLIIALPTLLFTLTIIIISFLNKMSDLWSIANHFTQQ